ncbi:hypothetical protein ACQGRZ_27915 [Bacillus wiedmannii]|uniref:hypothetical protein n=1 Tax=Bacillus wiedmannii TaxID=1890302 RepID=UPI003CF45125
MKARELVEHLQGILNQEVDVLIQYIIEDKQFSIVVRGRTKADKLLALLNDKHETVCISTEIIEEDIYIEAPKRVVSFVVI